jgi:hypothetical protein
MGCTVNETETQVILYQELSQSTDPDFPCEGRAFVL